jgi:hypothetical protein
MLEPFTIKIQSALTDRMAELEEHLLLPDPHYQALNTILNEVMDQIGQNLPPEKERFLLDLDKVCLERDALAYRMMYRQGLIDGINKKFEV